MSFFQQEILTNTLRHFFFVACLLCKKSFYVLFPQYNIYYSPLCFNGYNLDILQLLLCLKIHLHIYILYSNCWLSFFFFSTSGFLEKCILMLLENSIWFKFTRSLNVFFNPNNRAKKKKILKFVMKYIDCLQGENKSFI